MLTVGSSVEPEASVLQLGSSQALALVVLSTELMVESGVRLDVSKLQLGSSRVGRALVTALSVTLSPNTKNMLLDIT